MLIAVMNNLPELIMGTIFGGFCFWLGRRSVGFNMFEWIKKKFTR